jgi:hypothetical protein
MSTFDMDDWYLRMDERREAMTCAGCGEPFEDDDDETIYRGSRYHTECAERREDRKDGVWIE